MPTSRTHWSHPSVTQLLDESGTDDPTVEIARRAREVALDALEAGWSGPPFDPFELAERMGIETVASEEMQDARLVTGPSGEPRIEFNPNRRPARIRFSVAHELGHLLFRDHSDRVRYRDRGHSDERRGDDWQLEMLCNIAAAELLMPVGAFPSVERDLSLPHLLDLRSKFGVSTEALLRRIVKLADEPVCLFAAAPKGDRESGFRIDYVVPSRAWHPRLTTGSEVPADSVLGHCTAVGYADDATERWAGEDRAMRVQAVGIPPYPGERLPRVVGLLAPAGPVELSGPSLRYVRGNIAEPLGRGPRLIAHVVNDRARTWGGRGAARDLADRFPHARDDYARWSTGGSVRRLGVVHVANADEGLWVASMVAQAGYGESQRPRLRLPALRDCLAEVAHEALNREAVVLMPLIGTGQGRTPWATVRDLVLEELCERGIDVTVYVLPEQPMPDELPDQTQLVLA